jgi:hypothetical protein
MLSSMGEKFVGVAMRTAVGRIDGRISQAQGE